MSAHSNLAGRWLDEQHGWLQRAKENWSPRRVCQMTLRTWLYAPTAWDAYDGITIEGAIQCAVVMRETGRTPDDVFSDCPRDTFIDIPIPIYDTEWAGTKIACTSWAQPADDAAEDTRFRRKRARVESYGINGNVVVSSGTYKSQNIPIHTLVTPYLDFFVIGDPDKLGDLLVDVGALGRHRSGGVGAIAGWEIFNDPFGRSLMSFGWIESEERSGRRPMRTLPMTDELRDVLDPAMYMEREATTRAPYWNQATKRLCAVPIPHVGQVLA